MVIRTPDKRRNIEGVVMSENRKLGSADLAAVKRWVKALRRGATCDQIHAAIEIHVLATERAT